MKLLFVVAALIAGVAQAHPMLIQETAFIHNPDPTMPSCCGLVALDGDHAIFLAQRSVPDPESVDDTLTRALHLRLVDGEWTFVRAIGENLEHNEADANNLYTFDMRNGIAAAAMADLHVFERQGADYVESTVDHPFIAPSRSLDIDGGDIFIGDGCWGGSVVRKGTDGIWRRVASINAEYCGDNDESRGGPVAFAGASAAVNDPYNVLQQPPGLVMFRNAGGNNWQTTQRLEAEEGHFFGTIDMTENVMYAQDSTRYGTPRYVRSTVDGLWRPSGAFLRADGDHRLIDDNRAHSNNRIVIGDNFVLRNIWDHDKQVYVVQMFQYVATGELGHVATLAASDGSNLGGQVAVSGRRVLVGGSGGAYYFELPVAPRAPKLSQHTFDSTTVTGWTILPGSQFAVAQSGSSRVFRQSSTAGEAGAVSQSANWTNQAIQADVKPTAVAGSNRWVGLATRRTDSANYYYVALRSSGIIELKRMYQGSFGTLDSASLPFTLNRTYRLRLESVGSRHRVYVDGVLVLDANDVDLSLGVPALLSYRVAAEYDNVVVSPADIATLWERTGERVCDFTCPLVEWESDDGEWSWQQDGSNEVFAQSSLTTAGRAPAGAITRNLDQVVETRARLRAFGAGTDPWFGVMARYQDINNYAYLSLRRSNTLTLRKLVNGQIQELGAVAMTVTPGAWYRLRLDAVGNRLRAFVNGRQVLEVTDPQPTSGRVGVLTNRAQADFDDFIAVRP